MGIDAASHAFLLADGAVAVCSPPVGATDAVYAATEQLSAPPSVPGVVALLAPNSGHDLGQREWQQRYPAAQTYAPARAAQAILKAKPFLRPFGTLAELGSRLGPRHELIEVDGTRSGMTVLVYDGGESGRAMFVDEVLSNSPTLLGPAPFRFVSWLTGSGPGLARNKIWSTIFASNRRRVARTVLDAIDRHHPTVLLMAHGAPAPMDVHGEAVRRLLGELAR